MAHDIIKFADLEQVDDILNLLVKKGFLNEKHVNGIIDSYIRFGKVDKAISLLENITKERKKYNYITPDVKLTNYVIRNANLKQIKKILSLVKDVNGKHYVAVCRRYVMLNRIDMAMDLLTQAVNENWARRDTMSVLLMAEELIRFSLKNNKLDNIEKVLNIVTDTNSKFNLFSGYGLNRLYNAITAESIKANNEKLAESYFNKSLQSRNGNPCIDFHMSDPDDALYVMEYAIRKGIYYFDIGKGDSSSDDRILMECAISVKREYGVDIKLHNISNDKIKLYEKKVELELQVLQFKDYLNRTGKIFVDDNKYQFPSFITPNNSNEESKEVDNNSQLEISQDIEMIDTTNNVKTDKLEIDENLKSGIGKMTGKKRKYRDSNDNITDDPNLMHSFSKTRKVGVDKKYSTRFDEYNKPITTLNISTTDKLLNQQGQKSKV